MSIDHGCYISRTEIIAKSRCISPYLVVLTVIGAILYCLFTLSTQRAVAACLVLLNGLFFYLSSKTKEESLLIIPNVGINVKRKNLLGRSNSQFYDAAVIKDIVILEAVSIQRIITYLAVIVNGEGGVDQVHPIFMESRPPLSQLKEIYRQVQQTFFHIVREPCS